MKSKTLCYSGEKFAVKCNEEFDWAALCDMFNRQEMVP